MGRSKGLPKTGGRKIGSKNKTTIAKEQARSEYERLMLEEFGEIAMIQREEAQKRENVQERQYVLNQLLGKPKESVEISGEIGFNFDEVS